MVMVNIWCTAPDVPGVVCYDARLRNRLEDRPSNWYGGAAGEPMSSVDRPYGQAGWELGVRFGSLVDLRTRLQYLRLPEWVTGRAARQIMPGECRKLAIMAHGEQGVVFTSGRAQRNGSARARIDLDTLRANHNDLLVIGGLGRRGSIIYLMACQAGSSPELLLALSRGPWRGRYVVGFRATGYAPGGAMLRERADCTEPGMRDPGPGMTSGQNADGTHDQWNNLQTLPWATATSPSAVVAWDGAIVPRNELPREVD